MAPTPETEAVHERLAMRRGTNGAAQVPATYGLLRRSRPKVLSGPWPGMNTVSSPSGHSRLRMLSISVS